jgi:hypothetical protein
MSLSLGWFERIVGIGRKEGRKHCGIERLLRASSRMRRVEAEISLILH